MYGYVRFDRMEAKGREHEYYRGIYCGLCRALGKCGGQCARLTLQYDTAFLAAVRLALTGESPTFFRRRCAAHPFRRHTEAKPNEAVDFCAYTSLLLAYRKILDDKKDERGMRRLTAGVAAPILRGMSRRARKRYAALDRTIAKGLDALATWEASGEPSVDKPATLFGEIMGEVLSFGLDGVPKKLGMTIGRGIGKWVYLADAADDFEEDVRRGRYSPIQTVYGDCPDAAAWNSVRLGMTGALLEAEAAFDLLEYPDEDMRGVIRNILYVGLPSVTEHILSKKENRDHD